jgi:hypothetical protein
MCYNVSYRVCCAVRCGAGRTGVCEKPEVHCVDLKPILAALAAAGAYEPPPSPPPSPSKLFTIKSSTEKAASAVAAVATAVARKATPAISPKRLGTSPSRISPMDGKDGKDGK